MKYPDMAEGVLVRPVKTACCTYVIPAGQRVLVRHHRSRKYWLTQLPQRWMHKTFRSRVELEEGWVVRSSLEEALVAYPEEATA